MRKERPKIKDEYHHSFRCALQRTSESPVHRGAVILSHLAHRYAAEHGNTPTLFQDRTDAHGHAYKRQIYANADGRSALHIVDDYGDSSVKMTHVGGSKGIVTFINGEGTGLSNDLIVHPNDPAHVRLQMTRMMHQPQGAQMRRLMERVTPLHDSNILFPHAYGDWYHCSFTSPLKELHMFMQEHATNGA